MRRCDRKFLPILNEWTVVDVVMTRFEIVYFDPIDVDKVVLDQATEDVRQAMMQTDGGRGLRLCDVATGRRVVGRMDLSEISSAFVERDLPHAADHDSHTSDNFLDTEYWQQQGKGSMMDKAHYTQDAQWNKIREDRLKVQTTTGSTLYLRFYSDLEEESRHGVTDDVVQYVLSRAANVESTIRKDHAFHWAQTIVRFSGPEQLKQDLPHFADGTNDELRDLLVMKHRDGNVKGSRRHGSQGRWAGVSSTSVGAGKMTENQDTEVASNSGGRRSALRRSTSVKRAGGDTARSKEKTKDGDQTEHNTSSEDEMV